MTFAQLTEVKLIKIYKKPAKKYTAIKFVIVVRIIGNVRLHHVEELFCETFRSFEKRDDFILLCFNMNFCHIWFSDSVLYL